MAPVALSSASSLLAPRAQCKRLVGLRAAGMCGAPWCGCVTGLWHVCSAARLPLPSCVISGRLHEPLHRSGLALLTYKTGRMLPTLYDEAQQGKFLKALSVMPGT